MSNPRDQQSIAGNEAQENEENDNETEEEGEGERSGKHGPQRDSDPGIKNH